MRFLTCFVSALILVTVFDLAVAGEKTRWNFWPDRSCDDKTCPCPPVAKPDQAKPDQTKPDQSKPDQVKPDQTKYRAPDQVAREKHRSHRVLRAVVLPVKAGKACLRHARERVSCRRGGRANRF